MAYDDTIKKTLPMITSTFGSFLQNLFGGQLPSVRPQVMSDQDGFTNRDSLINRGIIPGNDTAANSGYALPSIMNSADLGTGRTPPPIVPGSVGLQAAPPIADASTPPPGPVVGGQPPPIVGQTVIPNLPALTSFSNPDIGTGRTPLPEAQPAPDQPTMMAGGNAYHTPVYEAGRERPIGNWFQPGAPGTETATPTPETPATPPPIVPAMTPEQAELRKLTDPTRFQKGLFKKPGPDGETIEMSDADAAAKMGYTEVVRQPGEKTNKKWSIWEKLGNAALGWAQGGLVGGIKGATDRNFFRKGIDEGKIAGLLPVIKAQQAQQLENAKIANELGKTGLEREKIASREKIAKDASDRASREGTLQTNPDTGQREWIFPHDPTRQPIAYINSKGKEVYDPEFKRTDYEDPRTHKTLSLKESDAANKNLQIASQDAAHQQTMETTNVKAVNDANIQFLKDQADYRQGVLKRMDEAVKAQAGMLSNESKVRGLEQKIGGLVKQINDAEAAGPTYDPAETKRREELWKQANDAQADMNTALAATVEGRAMLDQLKSQGLTPPKRYIPQKITAVKIGGGMTASRAEVQQYARDKKMDPGTAEARLKNLGYTIVD